jgi:hypothetical protein
MFLRFVLIVIVLYLVLRTLRAFLRPRHADRVAGPSPHAPKKIDENRVQDANFKDLPDE